MKIMRSECDERAMQRPMREDALSLRVRDEIFLVRTLIEFDGCADVMSRLFGVL
jgi:hypothetical protein